MINKEKINHVILKSGKSRFKDKLTLLICFQKKLLTAGKFYRSFSKYFSKNTGEKMQRFLINWLKPLLKKGKNLVYFASGTFVNPEYKKLNYANVFLVDKSFRQSTYDGKKIFCLNLECIEAVNLFKALDIKIHCFVCLNEGLAEGGGEYPINSDFFLGYCFPLFAPKLLHIGCKEYYSGREYHHIRHHFLDLPFKEKNEISPESEDYIPPQIFSYLGSSATITELKRKFKRKHKVPSAALAVYVEHNSIWSAANELDAIFLRFDSEFQKRMIEKFHRNVFPIKYKRYELYAWFYCIPGPSYKTYDTEEIIDLCKMNNYKKIGLIPNAMNYTKQIELFEKQGNGFPSEIHFYHLNKGDFAELYNKKWK